MKENFPHVETSLSRDAYALLAQANLLRMRGCWVEAVERCMAALRLAPDSSSAQSLLGDIYENQGRYDDAAQWYRMALDINPDSPADRLKLELLQRLRLGPLERSIPDPITAQIAEEPAGLRRWLRPEAALRFGAVAAAFLLILIVGMAYASTHRGAALASLGLASEHEVRLQPVVAPVAVSGPSGNAASALRDPVEQTLLDTLRGSTELASAGIIVQDVQGDPRSARLDLTFTSVAPTGGMTRAAALQQSERVLQAAANLPPAQTAALFTVRCLSASDTAAPLIFVGDAPRSSLPQADAVLTDAQRQSLFTNAWWSPQVPN